MQISSSIENTVAKTTQISNAPAVKTLSNAESIKRFYGLTPSLQKRYMTSLFLREATETRPELPVEMIQHILLQNIPETFNGSIESLFHSNHTIASIKALLTQMGINLNDEIKAINDMRDNAYGGKVSIEGGRKYFDLEYGDGHTYFDLQYGDTDLKRLLSFIREFNQLPSAVNNDETIEKRFVTESFIYV